MLSAAIFAVALGAAVDDAELVKNLAANWESQRSAIATAHFRARAFRHGSVMPLSQQEVQAVFASVDFAARPDDLRKVVAAICMLKEFSTPDPWSTIVVTIEGSKRRERTTNTPAGVDDNVADHGVTVLGMGPANQTSIVRTGNNTWNIRGLDDFRYVPNFGEGLIVKGREAGRVLLSSPDPKGPSIKLDVDETTGFVHSYRWYLESGVIANEVLQFGPVSYPGDLVLPTAIATLGYANGALRNANVLVILDAKVNIDLPRDAFAATAAKGTLIVDDRDPKHKNVFHARSDINDVAKAFPLNGSQPSTSVERSTTALVFVAVGAVVVALVLGPAQK